MSVRAYEWTAKLADACPARSFWPWEVGERNGTLLSCKTAPGRRNFFESGFAPGVKLGMSPNDGQELLSPRDRRRARPRPRRPEGLCPLACGRRRLRVRTSSARAGEHRRAGARRVARR